MMTLTTINRFFSLFGFVLVVGWDSRPGATTYFWLERIASYSRRVRDRISKPA